MIIITAVFALEMVIKIVTISSSIVIIVSKIALSQPWFWSECIEASDEDCHRTGPWPDKISMEVNITLMMRIKMTGAMTMTKHIGTNQIPMEVTITLTMMRIQMGHWELEQDEGHTVR